MHFVDAAALLLAVLAIAGEDDAVARRDGTAAASISTRRPRTAFTSPKQHAALGRAEAGHEHLVIAAAEPAGREAARERQLHLLDVVVGEVDAAGRPAPRRSPGDSAA